MFFNNFIDHAKVRRAIFFTLILAVSLSALSFTLLASSNAPKPGQVSTTCYYNLGAKTGQTEDLKGRAKPVLIGKPCTDGAGNSGISEVDPEAEAAEEAAKEKLQPVAPK